MTNGTELQPLVDRLRGHALDFRCTESEPERPGSVAFDLDLAADAIASLIVTLACGETAQPEK